MKTDEDLDVVCMDILQAGMETVGNSVAFMFLYMVCQENVQNKVIAEIDEVIGKRTPTLEDRRRYDCKSVIKKISSIYIIEAKYFGYLNSD